MKQSFPQVSASSDAVFTRREGRIFALTLAGGFLLVAAVTYMREKPVASVIALGIAAVAVLAGLLIPGRLRGVSLAWTRFGNAIGTVTTPILMTIVYYLVITPIGVVRRATKSRDERKSSYWYRRTTSPPPKAMERQF